jgi:hypothetical protein
MGADEACAEEADRLNPEPVETPVTSNPAAAVKASVATSMRLRRVCSASDRTHAVTRVEMRRTMRTIVLHIRASGHFCLVPCLGSQVDVGDLASCTHKRCPTSAATCYFTRTREAMGRCDVIRVLSWTRVALPHARSRRSRPARAGLLSRTRRSPARPRSTGSTRPDRSALTTPFVTESSLRAEGASRPQASGRPPGTCS